MEISQIISSSLPTLLSSNFQLVYDFLEEKYWDYDVKFSKDLDVSLYEKQDFYYSLTITEPKHLSILFKILLLCDLYEKSYHFLKIYDYLKQSNIKVDYLIEALKFSNITMHSSNDIKQGFLASLKALKKAYENDENIKLLNQVIKVYIFKKLKLNKMLKNGYNELLLMLKTELSKDYPFLDMNFFNAFLDEAKDKNAFFDKWSNKIHKIKAEHLLSDTQKIYAENSNYAHYIRQVGNINFDYIISSCKQEVNNKRLDVDLNHGQRLLETHEDLISYIRAYGIMHKLKLFSSFEKIIGLLCDTNEVNIIDYGCGQALGTINLIDFLRIKNINITINELILIEPSKRALQRGILYAECFLKNTIIMPKNKFLNDLIPKDLTFNRKTNTTIHIFSNILDMEEVVLNSQLYSCIENSLSSNNIFICVSPKISAMRCNRLDIFYSYFRDKYDTIHISNEVFTKPRYNFTKYEQIFQIKN